MYLVGLTGGIAAGKSTVAERFVMAGAELIDADAIAREQLAPGLPTWKKVVDHFGNAVVDEDGFVDRDALGRIVFSDPAKRALLNELTHPGVVSEIADRLELLSAFDGVVVLDVPLLVEAGLDAGYAEIVVVAASRATQLDRLIRLRGMVAEDAAARIAAQAPLEDKLAIATHVVWNDGSLTDLYTSADEVAGLLTRAAQEFASAQAAGIPND